MSDRGPSDRRQRFAGLASALVALLLAVTSAACNRAPVDSGRARTLVAPDATARYSVNREDPGWGMSWVRPEFDDGLWPAGRFGIGHERGKTVGAEALIGTDIGSPASSIYMRTTFAVEDPATLDNLYLGVDYDDGFVAWINGVEVARSESMPDGTLDWQTLAASHESSNAAWPRFHPRLDVSQRGLPALVPGENVLALGVWNHRADSSDLVLTAELRANQPLGVFVTRGPYLQSGTPDAVTVLWHTDRPTDSRLWYGPGPDELTGMIGDDALTTEHRLRIEGLSPDGVTHYAVGTSRAVLAGRDAEHAFRTAPLAGTRRPLRFWVLGDSGTASALAAAVRDEYRKDVAGGWTDSFIMLGDLAYPAGTDDQFQEALFETYPRTLRRSVLWATEGNHDGDTYYDVLELPTGGESGGLPSGTEAYYSFDYGNVHFISLNSELAGNAWDEMLAWAERDLQAAQATDWLVAFFHHAPYGTGKHDSDVHDRMAPVRRQLVPLLDRYGVDLALVAHTHAYLRSYLLRGHHGTRDTFDAETMLVDAGDGDPGGDGAYRKAARRRAGDGIVYAVVGCSGEAVEDDLSYPVFVRTAKRLGSLVLEVDGPRLEARLLGGFGNTLDHFAIVRDGSEDPARP